MNWKELYEKEYESLKAEKGFVFQAHSCDGSCEEEKP
jgi:hypothetical protein